MRNPEWVSHTTSRLANRQSTRGSVGTTLKTLVLFLKHLPKLHLTHKSLKLELHPSKKFDDFLNRIYLLYIHACSSNKNKNTQKNKQLTAG